MMTNMIIQTLAVILFIGKSVSGVSIYDPDSTNTTSKSISEGVAQGTFVYTVSGSSSLTYTKIYQSPDSPIFGFDSSTGELTAPAGLDAETVTSYEFLFSGTDGTDTVYSGTLTVTISNINDNPPVFSVSNYTTTIVNTVPDGYVIYSATATDLDITYINGYTITAGNTGSTFDIDFSTGVLTVKTASNLDPNVSPLYTLTIQVTDGTFNDVMTIYINVEADLCVPDPCQNSATCGNSNGTFVCNCTVGYIGVTCSDDDPCIPEPCLNSGTCTVSGSSYACACAMGYSGVNCTEMAIGTTTTITTNNNNSNSNNNNDDDDKSVTIIIAVVCSVIVLCLIGAILYLYLLKTRSLCFKPQTKADIHKTSFHNGSFSSTKNSVFPSDNTSLTAITVPNSAMVKNT
ncbi:hypothetical protein ACF0H5_022476 [Mactra antiquata]